MTQPTNYLNNVFINCPFDKGYHPLFEAIIFTIHDCGFIARCSKEENDSGNVRLIKIIKIIDDCRYGIHDISKADLDADSGLARFNMPLELGLFMGAQRYAQPKHYNRDKRLLVMDIEQFRYQSFISDIAGTDINAHHNAISEVILHVRDFLFSHANRISIAGGAYIATRFETFTKALPAYCIALHWQRDELTFKEYIACVISWIDSNPI
ncbi:MAG TPA: hypothetical protein DCO83_05330 [Mucilaginibacter sp.]|jgi:hypothetical protein|nr:hypothetical protein [Mucilaginibacter sp.]